MSVVFCENKDGLVDLDFNCDDVVVDHHGKYWWIPNLDSDCFGKMKNALPEDQYRLLCDQMGFSHA